MKNFYRKVNLWEADTAPTFRFGQDYPCGLGKAFRTENGSACGVPLSSPGKTIVLLPVGRTRTFRNTCKLLTLAKCQQSSVAPTLSHLAEHHHLRMVSEDGEFKMLVKATSFLDSLHGNERVKGPGSYLHIQYGPAFLFSDCRNSNRNIENVKFPAGEVGLRDRIWAGPTSNVPARGSIN